MLVAATDLTDWWFEIDWVVYRTAAAVLVGTVVGVEREFRDKPAGLRTLVLISLGDCVFSMVSLVMSGPMVDHTRIAAQVVTGVGFLGAGSILRSTKAVYGLTTAASIWMVAALGMACGFGHFGIAAVGTLATLSVLVLLHRVGHRIDVARAVRKYRIATTDPLIRFQNLEPYFVEAGLKVLRRNCYRQDERYLFTFRVRGPRDQHLALREKLLHTENLELQR